MIATMNEGSPDHGFSVDQEGNVLNGWLARVVFDAWVTGLPDDVAGTRHPAMR
ncbi:MAG: hypothetical protein IT336_05655 [Thermomicrobiales bacterium]|nr:hypothetical protein [Thermomicrobiales bacterium]